MPRESHSEMTIEGLLMPNKIRKRGCSSSSSASSRIHSYRLNKRAILVGKNRVGLGGSRSGTPAPTWRTQFLRSAIDSPKYSQSGKSTQPVSARKLAATLWEMNEMPSPKMSESDLKLMKQQQRKKNGDLKREKMQSGSGLLHSGSGSGSLPPHLYDPKHSPTVSEKMDRCGTRVSQRTPSISQRLRSANRNIDDLDSISNASFMEVETRSRPQTSSGSLGSGSRNRLKDVSNALTTSKELLKIVNRIWANADRPSSSMSVISALHSELERARLQVNQLLQEQPSSDKKEISYLMRCFAEEKALWKKKQQEAIEAAIGTVAEELEAERKLRRRIESLNKKLGKELADMKMSFLNAVEELQSEKRAREITEEVCDELARNIDENDRALEKVKSESVESNEEEEEEEEKVREKNSSGISKMRRQLEAFLGTKRNKDDESEVENAIYSKEGSLDSDSHSIEFNDKKDHKWAYYASAIGHDHRKIPIDVIKARHSISGQASRRSVSLQRSVSDVVEWGVKGSKIQSSGNGLDRERVQELENESHRRHRPVNGLQDHMLSSSRLSSARDRTVHDRVSTTSSKSRTADVRAEGQSSRRSRW